LIIAGESLTRSLSFLLRKNAIRGYARTTSTKWRSFWAGLASEGLFCFPALRFDVFSPQRDGRYRGAPKPWKEKQKGYNYCSAILMVHNFQSFLSVFT
jgi:hypothetical protein